MNNDITFTYEWIPTKEELMAQIDECEGKHTQQAIYSTFHSALTQVCFGCRVVRSTINRLFEYMNITKRDYFAGCALTGLLAGVWEEQEESYLRIPHGCAQRAFEFADAMLKESEKKESTNEKLAPRYWDSIDAGKLFGKNFFGVKEIKKTFTLQDGTCLVDIDEAEAEIKLREKLNEPDIKKFLMKLELGELNPDDFILILRVPTFADGKLITMQELNDRLQPDMTARGQGKLLYDIDWYANQPFYTTDPLTQHIHWNIVTRDVIPDSTSKTYNQQTQHLTRYAQEIGFDPRYYVDRREAVHVVCDHLVSLRTTHDRLHANPNRYDWTKTKAASGSFFVGVGGGVADGLDVNGWDPGGTDGRLGVVLSR